MPDARYRIQDARCRKDMEIVYISQGMAPCILYQKIRKVKVVAPSPFYFP